MIKKDLIAEIFDCGTVPKSVAVEAINMADDGAIETAVFWGAGAQSRATEYAEARYRDFRVLPSSPQ
jgi:hypothetical protein